MVQQYEATMQNFFHGISLSEGYIASSTAISLMLGILAFAFILFAAISIKRAQAFGIITAVLQPIGAFAATKAVSEFASLDYSALNISVTASSYERALEKAKDAYISAITDDILPQMTGFFIWLAVIAIVLIFSFIYFIALFKAKAKGFAIFAMIFTIIRFFMGPVSPLIFLNIGGIDMQIAWGGLHGFLFGTSAFFVAIQGVINLSTRKKNADSPDLTADNSEQ